MRKRIVTPPPEFDDAVCEIDESIGTVQYTYYLRTRSRRHYDTIWHALYEWKLSLK